ncbi:MAG: hypothetical protein EOR04_21955 [Mesorhizobium sp.]|uniref:hypothetical protein n=1 Tax=Mesorhizobium sp. TaxID=1871066 RepID=UPI000FE8961B|nr:hypothetical protein [Mesorhizobium sp.]RWP39661.1 MAG: hypothetical protein EOR04_21955 [Mesorhizobium sp.]
MPIRRRAMRERSHCAVQYNPSPTGCHPNEAKTAITRPGTAVKGHDRPCGKNPSIPAQSWGIALGALKTIAAAFNETVGMTAARNCFCSFFQHRTEK